MSNTWPGAERINRDDLLAARDHFIRNSTPTANHLVRVIDDPTAHIIRRNILVCADLAILDAQVFHEGTRTRWPFE